MHAFALLDRRSVIRVTGPDRASFLDGLLTADVGGATPGSPRPAALLTPQGKILHALWVHAAPDGDEAVLLDLPRDGAEDLLKRLSLFRLRAKVEIADVSDTWAVLVDAAGARRIGRIDDASPSDAIIAAYDAWRVAHGRPEQGVDYGAAEMFPADVNLDLLGGVDYRKGCFVGQEVVSRMKRRGSIRKRTLVLETDGPSPAPGAAITADGAALGQALGSAGGKTLALVRIDRLAAADPATITVGDRPARIAFPDWFPDDARGVGSEERS